MSGRPRTVLKPLAVFWLMVSHGSREAVAKELGVDAVTLRRRAADDIALQFAIDAGHYEYRRRNYPHGRATGYQQGCRCEDCTQANAAAKLAANIGRAARLAEAPHGTLGGYLNWRCRCTSCTAVHSEACRARYQSRRSEEAS